MNSWHRRRCKPHCLVKNTATSWGHINPLNQSWNLIVVCDTLGCLMNSRQLLIPSHWYYQLLIHIWRYVTFKRVIQLIARLIYGIVMLPSWLKYIINCWVWCLTDRSIAIFPMGQNIADSAGNPQRLWLLVEGIHTEIWVVSETRIHAEIQGNFQIGVEMRGKFPRSCKHYNSPKNDIKPSLGYFHTTGTPMPLYCILKFWGKQEGNFHVEISPGIQQGKEAEINT